MGGYPIARYRDYRLLGSFDKMNAVFDFHIGFSSVKTESAGTPGHIRSSPRRESKAARRALIQIKPTLRPLANGYQSARCRSEWLLRIAGKLHRQER